MLCYSQKINNIYLILKLSLYTTKVKLCYSLVPVLDLDGNNTEIAFFFSNKKTDNYWNSSKSETESGPANKNGFIKSSTKESLSHECWQLQRWEQH